MDQIQHAHKRQSPAEAGLSLVALYFGRPLISAGFGPLIGKHPRSLLRRHAPKQSNRFPWFTGGGCRPNGPYPALHALSLYFVFHNFVRISKAHRMTPAMAAGITLAALVDARNPVPACAVPNKKRVKVGEISN